MKTSTLIDMNDSPNFMHEDAFDTIRWVKLGRINHYKISPNQITVGFSHGGKKKDIINRIVIRMGEGIANEMGWKPGDRLETFYDPNNVFNILLTKCEPPRGYKLTKEKASPILSINITWSHPTIILTRKNAAPVKLIKRHNRLILMDIDK